LAGLERLRHADVIVYDRLVNSQLLAEARPEAEHIFVGKEADAHALDQEAINRLLVAKARERKTVVRLKGGDPFVFGRGGEEAYALRQAGIPFGVVPGVTAPVAVPAYAGIPITHRTLASSFAVIPGHEDFRKGASALRWDKLATAVDTLVLLMGTRTLGDIAQKLVDHGRPADTPVAVVQWGTTPRQRTVIGTLTDIAQRVKKAGLVAPTVTVVGEVVSLQQALAWYETRPLFGKRVMVTRTRQQAGVLARLLVLEGAIPIELPAIEIRPSEGSAAVAQAIEGLSAGVYGWVVFTSANGVDIFFRALAGAGRDARAFGGARLCAIGPATAEALAERGLVADLVPQQYIAEGLVEALRGHLRPSDRVLLPRAESARPELVEGLGALGAEVDEVPLYRAAAPQEVPAEALDMLRCGAIDIVTFTSSSTVHRLVQLLSGDVECLRKAGVACIGPVTAKTAEEVLGRPPDVVAAEHTVPGMVRALADHFNGS
jgi:uroporphyrinogen III methyltransferase/synthase